MRWLKKGTHQAVPFLVLLCAGCRRAPELPALPDLKLDTFLAAVRDEIRPAYDRAKAHPEDPAANGRLGMVLHAHQQYDAASACYTRAQRLDPRSVQWTYYLGVVQASQGRNEPAAAALRRTLALKPDYTAAKLRLAEVLFSAGKFDDSRRMFEGLGDSAQAHYWLGRIRAAQGDRAGAAEEYRKALELFPYYGAAHYALRSFELAEKYKTTVPPLEDPLLAEVSRLNVNAVAHIRRGTELEQAGRREEAAAAHEKALELDPNLVQAHVNLITLYARLQRFDKAEEHYRAVQRLNPNQADAHYNFGVALFEARKYEQAEAAFRRALEINPNYSEALHNYGYLLEQQGKLDQALAYYGKALDNKPDYPLAHFHAGRILVNRKQYAGAVEHFLKTLAGPEDDQTPGYLYALAAAYGRWGRRDEALRYARQARDMAAARRQPALLASIERDLRILERGR